MLPHRASVMSSTRRTDTPARYILRVSSTLLFRRRYRSMMAVSKEIPLSLGTLRVTSPEVVVRLMKNIGLDRLIGPDVLSCYRDYFYMIGGIMLVLFVPLGPLLSKQ